MVLRYSKYLLHLLTSFLWFLGTANNSVLASHVSAVRKCQASVIGTAQLVQEQVQQLVHTRQQLDAHRLALHHHLQAITTIFSAEPNKSSVAPIFPVDPIKSTSTNVFSAETKSAIKNSLDEFPKMEVGALNPGRPISTSVDKTESLPAPAHQGGVNNIETIQRLQFNGTKIVNPAGRVPTEPNHDHIVAVSSSVPQSFLNTVNKVNKVNFVGLNPELSTPSSFLVNKVSNLPVNVLNTDPSLYTPKMEESTGIKSEFHSPINEVTFIDSNGKLYPHQPGTFVHKHSTSNNPLPFEEAKTNSGIAAATTAPYSPALNLSTFPSATSGDIMNLQNKIMNTSQNLFTPHNKDGNKHITSTTEFCMGKPIGSSNAFPASVAGFPLNSSVDALATTQTGKQTDPVNFSGTLSKYSSHSFDAVNLIGGSRESGQIRSGVSLSSIPTTPINVGLKQNTPLNFSATNLSAATTASANLFDGSVLSPINIPNQPRPSSLPGTMIRSLNGVQPITSRVSPTNISLSSSTFMSRSTPTLNTTQPTVFPPSTTGTSNLTTLTTVYNSTLPKPNFIPSTTTMSRKTYLPNTSSAIVPGISTTSTLAAHVTPHNTPAHTLHGKVNASSHIPSTFSVDQVIHTAPNSPLPGNITNINGKSQYIPNPTVIVSTSPPAHGSLNLTVGITSASQPEVIPSKVESVASVTGAVWPNNQYVVSTQADLTKPYFTPHHIINNNKDSSPGKGDNFMLKPGAGRVVHGMSPNNKPILHSTKDHSSKSAQNKRASSHTASSSAPLAGKPIGVPNNIAPTTLASPAVFAKKLHNTSHKMNGAGGAPATPTKAGVIGSQPYKMSPKGVIGSGQQQQQQQHARVGAVVNQARQHHKRPEQKTVTNPALGTTSGQKHGGQFKAMHSTSSTKSDQTTPGKVARASHKPGVAFTPYTTDKTPSSKVQPWLPNS